MRLVRTVRTVLTASFAASVLVGLPVVTLPAAAAKPVSPEVRTAKVDLVPAEGKPGQASSAVREPGRFSIAGLRWSAASGLDADVVLRTRGTDGRWADWAGIEVADAASTGGVVTTEPLYVGPSNAVQVVVRGRRPADLEVVTVDPGTSEADSALNGDPLLGGGDTAEAAATRPPIITRAQWGADESLRCSEGPGYSGELRAAAVHHTAGSNDYTASESASIVRGIYAYHTKSNGWCDIGYNFLVDKYGQVFEGRFGGIDRPVIGAHTGGFNTGTVGVSVLGDYEQAELPQAGFDALTSILAWKLSMYRLDATGTVTLTSGGTPRYAAGTKVTVGVVFGHGDVGSTACPGAGIYGRLGEIRQKVKAMSGSYGPFGSLDSVSPVDGGVRVAGWAIEPGSSAPVQVHAYVGSQGTAMLADQSRPDVGKAYPEYGPDHGFARVLPAEPGQREVCAYAISTTGAPPTLLGCRSVVVPAATGPPFGELEIARAGVGSLTVSGWAIDPDTAGHIQVHLYVGTRGTAMLADLPRPDVAADYPKYGERHGFSRTVLAGVGTQEVCAYAIDVGGTANTLLGCREVTVTAAPPIGSIDGTRTGPQQVTVSGWAVDPGTAAPIDVHAYVGSTGRSGRADGQRDDIARAYPEVGGAHGYSITVPAPPGRQTVCTYGIAASGKGPNSALGCRAVDVPTGPPIGSVDSVTAVPGGVVATGWALDPDTAAPIQVHAYVGGTGTAMLADAVRPDVGAAYPGWGAERGYTRRIATAPGPQQVCLYAINTGAGSNVLLGCRTVTVLTGDPLGSLDSAVPVAGGVRVSGWAFDPDTDGSIQVHAYVGAAGTAMLADQPRADVQAAYPGYGRDRAFSRTLTAAPGQRQVCVYAIDVGPGSNRLLGCRTVTVR